MARVTVLIETNPYCNGERDSCYDTNISMNAYYLRDELSVWLVCPVLFLFLLRLFLGLFLTHVHGPFRVLCFLWPLLLAIISH